MRQEDGVALAVRQVIEAAQLMGHGMDVAEAGVVEGHAGQVLGKAHALARLDVLAVGHGRTQVLGNQLDGLLGGRVGHGVGDGGHVGLDRVGEGVHTGGRGQCRRHADHQKRIVHGDARGHAPVDDGHLHVAGGVGDDAEAGHFRSGTGGGVHGQVRRHRLGGLVHALVIMNLAAVGDHQAHALAAVVGGAAAQGDEAVALLFLVDVDAVMHVLVGGVGDGLVIDHVFHLGGVEQVGDLLGDAGAGDALVGDDQRLGTAEGLDLLRDLLGCADADEGDTGNEIAVDLLSDCHDVPSFSWGCGVPCWLLPRVWIQ